MGKFLIITGIVLVIVGLLMQFPNRIPLLGKLPGDIRIERENFSFYFPIMSCIVLSIIISVIMYLVNRGKS